AFSFSAVSFAARLRGAPIPPWPHILTAFATALGFFLQLRIADEHKDFVDDSKWRPYRAVPRGLVTLRELAWLGCATGGVQLALALWLSPRMLPVLSLAWIWLVLMTKEFFVPDWLRRRPIAYLLSHMVILPLVDLYATACDWRALGAVAPTGLGWFLALSYTNGLVLEIGRKLRATEQEEEGVETYSKLWGPNRAAAIWVTTLAATFALAIGAGFAARATGAVAFPFALVLIVAAVFARRYALDPAPRTSKPLEAIAGVWTLALYLTLGLVPRCFP
ncbi:MAG: hypothetical protein ACKO5K_10380, partial [Armatimonadota bacterium]